MGVVPYVLGDAGNQQVSQSGQVFFPVEVLQHVLTSSTA